MVNGFGRKWGAHPDIKDKLSIVGQGLSKFCSSHGGPYTSLYPWVIWIWRMRDCILAVLLIVQSKIDNQFGNVSADELSVSTWNFQNIRHFACSAGILCFLIKCARKYVGERDLLNGWHVKCVTVYLPSQAFGSSLAIWEPHLGSLVVGVVMAPRNFQTSTIATAIHTPIVDKLNQLSSICWYGWRREVPSMLNLTRISELILAVVL